MKANETFIHKSKEVSRDPADGKSWTDKWSGCAFSEDQWTAQVIIWDSATSYLPNLNFDQSEELWHISRILTLW